MPDPTTVSKKYEGIYVACAELIDQVLSVDTVSNDERYAYLQRAVPAIWAATVHSEFPLKSDEALANCISDYENAECRLQTLDGISETSLGHVDQWKRQWISKSLSCIDFDYAVELGSGWGHRLVDLWRWKERPKWPFLACDLSEGGVHCTTLLQSLFPEMTLNAFQFDMLTPEFDFFDHTPKRPLIFIVHAIEQIPEVPSSLFDKIIDRFPNATVVHFEPVTFQLPDQSELNADRYAYDLARAKHFNKNNNLFEILSKHPKVNLVRIEPAVWQVAGQHSVSMIQWRASE